jgi:hypothetical protein
MNKKSKIGVLLAVLCIVPAEQAVSAVCKQGVLDGDRLLVSDCGDGSCGAYQVGSDGMTSLGFGTTQPDVISFEFYSFTADPPATGTFDLGSGDNSNYASCAQCILIFQDFTGSVPLKTFFQTGGTLTVDASTVPGIAADVLLTWSNVTMAEVTIDSVTFESTLVPNGDCYNIVADKIFADGFQGP